MGGLAFGMWRYEVEGRVEAETFPTVSSLMRAVLRRIDACSENFPSELRLLIVIFQATLYSLRQCVDSSTSCKRSMLF